jgi:myosin heavy subunit
MGQLLREGEGVPDFVLMDKLTEDALYANLHTRYKKDQIYTYIGSYSLSLSHTPLFFFLTLKTRV